MDSWLPIITDSDSSTTVARVTKMPPSSLATVDWDALTKVPILNAGNITPDVMHEYEDDCINFFDAKEIPADKQVWKIPAGIKDHHIKDWISVEREALLALTFEEFMVEFRTNYLEEDLESQLHCSPPSEELPFDQYAIPYAER